MKNLGKYFEDKLFVQKVIESTPESEAWLNKYESLHPAERENIRLARRIVAQFKTRKKPLSEDEKIVIFSRVINEIERKNQIETSRKLWAGLARYAAVAFLFFSIGALVFHRRDKISPEFFSHSFPEATGSAVARLIRSTGEDIALKKDHPVLEHSAEGVLQIDDEIVTTRVAVRSKAANTFNQLIIPYGKTSQVILSDGSRVFLNAGSRLVYPEVFSGSTREVLLTGEAFFEVQPDEGKPFVVQTTDLRIKVLGTSFNLSAYASDSYVEAVLVEGKITVGRTNSGLFDKSSELLPGQLASYNRTNNEMRVRQVDLDDYILWKDGIYKFESVHLSRILKRLERYYNVRFQFRNAFLGTIQISGKLELKEELNETLERLALAAHVKIVKTQEGDYEVN